MQEQNALALEFVLELRVLIDPLVELGRHPAGMRRTVAITGGSFRGPALAGRVLPGGADWQIVEDDGLTSVDAHYTLETDDSVRIEVRNRGVRHGPADMMERIAAGQILTPTDYYFRTIPRFYPPEGKYDWLRRSIFVGSGERYADQVIVRVWAVR